MDQHKSKHMQLKFEDYLSFFKDRHADKLTCCQLDQILSMHGFVKLNSHTKAMNAVSSLDLVTPTRSTITSSTYCPMLPLSLVEVQLTIQEMEWEECPMGSVMSYCAASDSSSSVSTVISELTGIYTKEKKIKEEKKLKEEKKIKKEKIHDTNAGLVAGLLPVKTMRLPVGSLKEHDVYSWRKYSSRKKENIVCRWYYGCHTKSCPARKSVVTDPHDSSMCIITYIGEHNHSIP